MFESGPNIPVRFEPIDRTVWVPAGATVLTAARRAGVALSATCGGRGTCGLCGVRVVFGELEPPTPEELGVLRGAPPGVRLACKARVVSPVAVRPLGSTAVETSSSSAATSEDCVVGVDLGTTSVAAIAVDVTTGVEIGRAVVPNAQSAWGADVLSRISASLAGARGELRIAAEESVLKALRLAAGDSAQAISRVAIAANTAMASMLCGVDVKSLAHHPFAIPAGSDVLPDASALRAQLPECEFHVVPAMASFVGGDALAGALAHGLVDTADAMVLVDIGTNAEVVVAMHGGLWVSSAPAGPAFEGGAISQGGPAVPGAVTGVAITGEGEVDLCTIGGVEPAWFSGAGLVSAVAALRGVGQVSSDGVLVEGGLLGSRIHSDDAGVLGIELSGAELRLTQLDIRALQLAKGAVRVAIDMTLSAARIRDAGVKRLLVAGAFGAALRAEDLVGLGIVSQGLASSITPVGNAALEGAVAIAFDPQILERWSSSTANVEWVDLASDPQFNSRLMSAFELAPYDR